MIKSGYGSLTDTLISAFDGITDVPLPSNRNAIIQVSAKREKRIFTISAGYRLAFGSSGTALLSGRLLVVGAKIDDAEIFINPIEARLPDEIAQATVYHDMPILGEPAYYDTTVGIYIPKATDVSVILTFCGTTGGAAVFPASESVIAFLNVQGLFGGVDRIFKDVD